MAENYLSMKLNNNFISILITNYNKSKFLNKSLNSLIKQNYKNYEIIFFDDGSTDKSIEIVKQYKNIRLIKNLKKKSSAALNQINGLQKAFEKSKGNIVCLMDSDDFFFKNKLMHVSNFFYQNEDKNILFNYPKIFARKKFSVKKKINKNIWPTIFPTSCISIRRNTFKKFINYMVKDKFNRLEIDARLCIFSRFFLNEYNIINQCLTIYNYDPHGITANIPKYSKFWWIRRKQAFEYLRFIFKKKKIKFKLSFDYYVTLIISFTLQKVT